MMTFCCVLTFVWLGTVEFKGELGIKEMVWYLILASWSEIFFWQMWQHSASLYEKIC